jgi:hypothetical protein
VRRAIGLLLLLAIVLFARHAGAEDVPVPVGLQAELLSKVAGYDRNFAARAGERAHVLLVQRPGDADSARVVAQMQSALGQVSTIGGLPHDETIVSYAGAAALVSAVKGQHAAVVFFTPGFADQLDALRGALAGVDVLTAAAVPDYVPRGVVLGFDLVGGKPKLLVNITQAGKQNVAFRAEVLKMMKVYE